MKRRYFILFILNTALLALFAVFFIYLSGALPSPKWSTSTLILLLVILGISIIGIAIATGKPERPPAWALAFIPVTLIVILALSFLTFLFNVWMAIFTADLMDVGVDGNYIILLSATLSAAILVASRSRIALREKKDK
jgi:hypothetical protein